MKIDLNCTDSFQDPYHLLQELRELRKPIWNENRFLVFDYDNAQKVLKDKAFTSTRMNVETAFMPEDLAYLFKILSNMFNFKSGPDHGRLRAPFREIVSEKHLQKIIPLLQKMSKETIEEFHGRNGRDIVPEISRFTVLTMLEVLQIPREQEKVVFEMIEHFGGLLRMDSLGRENPAKAYSVILDFKDQFTNYIDKRISTISGQYSKEEYLANLIEVILAGTETTTHLISSGLFYLGKEKGLISKINDEKKIESFIEEVLRFESPIKLSSRLAVEDIVLNNVEIKSGSRVTVYLSSANRDSKVFEDSEVFNPFRISNPHIAFGSGQHYCMGSQLARIEGKIFISEWIRKKGQPNLLSEKAVWLESPSFRGLKSLHLLNE
jgi:pimeloyl-[acyl-carrier protein] synthase